MIKLVEVGRSLIPKVDNLPAIHKKLESANDEHPSQLFPACHLGQSLLHPRTVSQDLSLPQVVFGRCFTTATVTGEFTIRSPAQFGPSASQDESETDSLPDEVPSLVTQISAAHLLTQTAK